MTHEAFAMNARGLLLTLGGSVAFAELVGYLLHRLLHSHSFPSLSRAHLIHHLEQYGPHQPMRTPAYKNATVGRASLGNIGMEWTAPVVLILTLSWLVLKMLGMSLPYRMCATGVMVLWPVFMFSYLHDRMHLQGFWMERAPIVRFWFVRARRLHDIHHHCVNDDGRMDANFGIGFFFFDRLFGTMVKRHRSLNCRGVRNAIRCLEHDRRGNEDFPNFPSSYRV